MDDPKHSPFLKSFGQFQVATLSQTEASPDKVMLEMLTDMQRDVNLLRRRLYREETSPRTPESIPPNMTVPEVISAIISDHCKTLKLKPEQLLNDRAYAESLRHQMASRFGVETSPAFIRRLIREFAENS